MNFKAQHRGLPVPLSLPAKGGAPTRTPPAFSLTIPWKYCPRVCSQPGILEHCTKCELKSPSLAAVYQQIPISITREPRRFTPRPWQAAFLPGIHEFEFPKCFMGLIFLRSTASPPTPTPPAGPFHQEKASHTQPETKRGIYG